MASLSMQAMVEKICMVFIVLRIDRRGLDFLRFKCYPIKCYTANLSGHAAAFAIESLSKIRFKFQYVFLLQQLR